jgi:hypothetical protein
MFPGVIAGIITAIYYTNGQSEFITAVMFCSLVTYAIVTSMQIKILKENNQELNRYISTNLVTNKDLKYVRKSVRKLDEKINYVAQAASDEIEILGNNMGTEIHDLARFVAITKFGPEPEEDEEGNNV